MPKADFTSGATYDATTWTVVSGGGASLPRQTGNAGKFLTTDGTSASWGTPAVVIPASGDTSGATDVVAIQAAPNGKAIYNTAAAKWKNLYSGVTN